MPTFAQFAVWLCIGLIGGALAGRLMTWDREGYGRWPNFALGLAGALIGGFIFRVLGLFPELDKYAVSLRDIVASLVGALLLLAALWFWNRPKGT